jgi:hypothetical protein
MSWDEFCAANRRNWDERVAIHRRDATGFYAIERFLAGDKRLHAIDSANSARLLVGQVDSVLKGVPANAIENCRSSESRKALTRVRYDQVIPVFLTR